MNIDTSKHQRVIPENEYQYLMGLVTVEKDLKLITSLLLDFMFERELNRVEFPTIRKELIYNTISNIHDFFSERGYYIKCTLDNKGNHCISGIERVEKTEVK